MTIPHRKLFSDERNELDITLKEYTSNGRCKDADRIRIIRSFHDGYKTHDLIVIFQMTQETVRRYIDNYEKFRTIRSKSCNAGAQPILNIEESTSIDQDYTQITYNKTQLYRIS